MDGGFFFRHLLPKSLIRNETLDFESKLSSGHPIFLYLHGSTGTRFVSFSCKHFMALSCSELMPIFFSFLFYGQWLKERVGCNIIYKYAIITLSTHYLSQALLCTLVDFPIAITRLLGKIWLNIDIKHEKKYTCDVQDIISWKKLKYCMSCIVFNTTFKKKSILAVILFLHLVCDIFTRIDLLFVEAAGTEFS